MLTDKITQNLLNYQATSIKNTQKQAAVLVAILASANNPKIILTKRSTMLTSHPGEIALPGGKYDVADQTLMNTALRETEEEIGLSANRVKLIGSIGYFFSSYGLPITAFVGLVEPDSKFKPNKEEIDTLFQVPVSFLVNKKNQLTEAVRIQQKEYILPYYQYKNHKIWGVTALILRKFITIACATKKQV